MQECDGGRAKRPREPRRQEEEAYHSPVPHHASRLLIALAFVAFISLGLPDGVLGVAWPSIRKTFERPLSQVGFLLGGAMAGYLCASFFGGQALRLLGVGRLLVVSCLLVAVSLSGYWLSPFWPALIGFAIIGGLGGGAIDAGINAFAASHFSPRVVNWLHASFGVGATIGPLLMTAVLASAMSWRIGYAILAAALLGLSMLFMATVRLWEDGTPAAASDAPHATATLGQALARPMVWLHALLFCLYTGVETTAGQLLFTLFVEGRNIPETPAGIAVGAYWAALTVGRIVFGQLSATWGHVRLLRTGMLLAPVAAAMIAWAPASWIGFAGPWVAFAGTLLLGFALAPIFPTLISITPHRVGRAIAPHAVGFQVAAGAVGIAAIPSLVAVVARRAGLEAIPACLILLAVAVLVLHEVILRVARARDDREERVSPAPAA